MSMRRDKMSLAWICITASACLCLHWTAHSASGEEDSAASLIGRMKASSAKLTSLAAEWEQTTRTLLPEAIAGIALLPPSVHKETVRLRTDGNKLYCDYCNQGTSTPRRRSTFDGEASIRLTTQREPPYPFAVISGDTHNYDSKNLDVAPTLKAFRPFDERFGDIPESSLKLAADEARLRDRECRILVRHLPKMDAEHQFWVVPSEGDSIGRVSLHKKGVLRVQTDISYKPIDGHYLPEEWTIQWFDQKGVLEKTMTAKITSYSINAPLLAEEFLITIPAGAMVTDLRSGKDYRIPGNEE